MKTSTIYSILWLAWLGAFLAIELSALWSGRSDLTLSWYVWRLEKLGTTWTFLRYFVAAFLVWLTLHLVFGWWR